MVCTWHASRCTPPHPELSSTNQSGVVTTVRLFSIARGCAGHINQGAAAGWGNWWYMRARGRVKNWGGRASRNRGANADR